jgi:hypothetical protein
MSRLGVLTALAWIALTGSTRADERVWDVENWPADAGQIPCSAWSKATDGTWVLHGAVKLGSSEISNVGVKGDAAARLLDRQCGGKK